MRYFFIQTSGKRTFIRVVSKLQVGLGKETAEPKQLPGRHVVQASRNELSYMRHQIKLHPVRLSILWAAMYG